MNRCFILHGYANDLKILVLKNFWKISVITVILLFIIGLFIIPSDRFQNFSRLRIDMFSDKSKDEMILDKSDSLRGEKLAKKDFKTSFIYKNNSVDISVEDLSITKEVNSDVVLKKRKPTRVTPISAKVIPASKKISPVIPDYEDIPATAKLPFVKNVYDYRYIKSPIATCKQKMKLLILVKSSAGNYDQRQNVRKSYGYPSNKHRVIFVLGNKPELAKYITEENNQYHDILQADFTEAYTNLTLKDMLAFKWVVKNCNKKLNWIALVDDDMYISVDKVIDFYKHSKEVKKGRFYGGWVQIRSPTIRDTTHRNYISHEEVPERYYPPYTSGRCSFFTRDTIGEMYNASITQKHIRIDDAYLGMLAGKLNITPVNLGQEILHVYDKAINVPNVLCKIL